VSSKADHRTHVSITSNHIQPNTCQVSYTLYGVSDYGRAPLDFAIDSY